MKTAVASDDEKGPKKKFGIGLPKSPRDSKYGIQPDSRESYDRGYGHVVKKTLPKKASAGANPDNPKGPKVNNKMKVVPLKQKTITDQERQKAKAKESLKKKATNRKKK